MLSLIFEANQFRYMAAHTKSYLSLITIAFFCVTLISCRPTSKILKPEIQLDTLDINMDLRLIDDVVFKDSIQKKMKKFTDAYNQEVHPFKLSLNKGNKTSSITIQVLRSKFVSKQKSLWASCITAAGLGTASVLIASGFVIPVGWLYIPNAKSTILPAISTDISELPGHHKVIISSVGMFRPMHKQYSVQGKKLVKYVVEMVLQIEEEYKKTP